MKVCHIMLLEAIDSELMKVRSRWIEEIPMIDIASLALSTLAFTWDSHSGWSG